MKKTSKILALVLVVAMVVAMGVGTVAFAAGTYSITIDNAVDDETYTAYKIFDVTYSGTNASPGDLPDEPDPDGRHEHTAYSYTITTDSEWWSTVTGNHATTGTSFTANGLTFTKTTTSGLWNVVATEDFDAAEFAATLDAAKSGKTESGHAVASGGTATIDTLNPDAAGYYFVDTTLGSLCSLDTTEPSATIREKNTIPSEDKTVTDGQTTGSQDNEDNTETTVKIGDTVTFTITVLDSKGTDKAIKVHDIMSDGLTLDVDSFTVTGPKDVSGTKTEDQTLVAGTDYTIVIKSGIPMKDVPSTIPTGMTIGSLTDGCSFEIVLTAAYVAYLEEEDVVTITYDAELNKDAETASPYETNKSHLDYSEQSTTDVETTVKTYEGDIVKTDGADKVLDGATFTIYDAATGGNAYDFVMVGTPTSPATTTGVYEIKSSDNTGTVVTELVPLNGKLTLKGLETGTYYIEEVEHPEGYNPLTERKALVINNANNSATITGDTYTSGGTQVINQSGTELPSTGGIGTTIFYVVGAILVVGAVVILVTRRRMSVK